jgi:para-aminobenzoate synthetase
VRHNSHPLFADIPSGEEYQVVRYHSLAVEQATLPASLVPLAWTHDAAHPSRPPNILMALAHATQPHYGVQFHPESVCTLHGALLMRNFLQLARSHLASQPRALPALDAPLPPLPLPASLLPSASPAFALPRPNCNAPAAAASSSVEGEEGPQQQPGLSLMWRKLSHSAASAGGSDALFWCAVPLTLLLLSRSSR